MEPYRTSLEHIRDEMARLDLMVRRGLILARRNEAQAPPDLRGLVISEPEIEEFLRTGDLLDRKWRLAAACRELLDPLDRRLDAMRAEIDRRRALSDRAHVELALPRLARCFELAPVEVDIILIALAPELEPGYETLYGYLHNDVTRRRPSVELALALVCRSLEEKVSARRFFAPGATLRRNALIRLLDEPHDREPALARRLIRVDQAVIGFLLGQPHDDLAWGRLTEPAAPSADGEIDAPTLSRLRNLSVYLARLEAGPTAVHLAGDCPDALGEAARTLACCLGRPLFTVDPDDFDSAEVDSRLAATVRDAALLDALVAVRAAEERDDEERTRRGAWEKKLWRSFERFAGIVMLLGPNGSFAQIPPGFRVMRTRIEEPDFGLRRGAWERALKGDGGASDSALLADMLHLGPGAIQRAVQLAQGLAAMRDPERASPSTRDLLEAGRTLAAPTLGRFAVRIEPRFAWGDLVLPGERMEQLKSISARMKLRSVVDQRWGFGAKLARGKGLNLLFTGPSGTGKTMAAEILANELGLELYQIDLSSVVSKYIGETEKHLAEIFREAQSGQVLLFFDEADALFGKRTEVKDAHDRYANIEVNYLLQRIEQFEGIAVLATNLQRSLDEAFLRRMHEVVEFPLPDEEMRERIWRGHFPPAAPRDAAIDFGFLARQFKLTGGNIRNIVHAAAYLAARSHEPIGMPHLILATRAEHQKLGKLCVKADFGPYYGLLGRNPPAPNGARANPG